MGGNCCRKRVIFSLVAPDSLEELLVDGPAVRTRRDRSTENCGLDLLSS